MAINPSLFQALGGQPPQAASPAAPGSPGSAAGLPSLYQGLQQPDMSSQPLQLGPMIAANGGIDEGLKQSLMNAFGHKTKNSSAPTPPPTPQPTSEAVNPYSNLANKATGKDYK